MIEVVRLAKHAWRASWRRPRLTVVAVLTLALPMALDIGTFSIADAVLLRPLPLREPDQLVRVRRLAGEGPSAVALSPSWEVYRRWRLESRSFDGMAAATGSSPTLGGMGDPVRVPTARVSANFFSVLGIHPVVGRDFRADEEVAESAPVVLVGDAFWRTRLGGSSSALGRTLDLDGVPHVVVGVLPPRVRHPYDADLFVPLRVGRDERLSLYCPARLRHGVKAAAAEGELAALGARMSDLPPAERPGGALLMPLRTELMGQLGPRVLSLAFVAALVLLIAAANLAAVLVAQKRARRPELALRRALGARRGDLAKLALAEAALLSGLATAIALPTAGVVVRAVLRLAPFLRGDFAIGGVSTGTSYTWRSLTALNEFDIGVRIGPATVLYAVGAALLLTLLLAAASGIDGGARDLRASATLQRVRFGRTESRLLRLLIVVEIAAAVVVVAGATGVVGSFRERLLGSPGYEPRGVRVFEVDLPPARYPDGAAIARFAREASERLRAVPGVLSVGATTLQPLDPGTVEAAANLRARPAPDPPGYYFVNHRQVLPGYLETLGVRLLAGRLLDDRDGAASEPVVIIDRALARRLWPGGNAVGQEIKRGRLDDARPTLRVVGVVESVRERHDAEAIGTWYVPLDQQPDMTEPELRLLVRVQRPDAATLGRLPPAIRGGDAALAVGARGPMEVLLRESLGEERLGALLLSLLGGLALLLAAIGIHGLLAHWVNERTRELAIRAALGCTRGALQASVLREAALLFGAGAALGAAGALALRRVAVALLADAGAVELRALSLAVLALAVVALVAAWVPARHAGKAAPGLAMRAD